MTWYVCCCGAEHDTPTCPLAVCACRHAPVLSLEEPETAAAVDPHAHSTGTPTPREGES